LKDEFKLLTRREQKTYFSQGENRKLTSHKERITGKQHRKTSQGEIEQDIPKP